MKAKLTPLYFGKQTETFVRQRGIIEKLLADEADFLDSVELGKSVPEDSDGVVFFELLGDIYRRTRDLPVSKKILVLTSEFGTSAMWDWEIISYLRDKGIEAIAPYSLEQAKAACRALAVKKQASRSTFLVFQDNPGEGMQPEIFKRFFWWEEEFSDLLKKKFGVSVIRRSFKKLGARAREILLNRVEGKAGNGCIQCSKGVTPKNVESALKMYEALKTEIESDSSIVACGINCLNESSFSDTTPCLAWDLLYRERGLIWGCEADLLSMLTQYLFGKALGSPLMMTNIYPFLSGMTALKHEKIDHFPDVKEPEHHALAAHCGYFGIVPPGQSESWTLQPRVLGIVDENAIAIDARLPVGDITIIKIGQLINRVSILPAQITGYAQYPGSDCRNGAVLKVSNGYAMMDDLTSHHICIVPGKRTEEALLAAKVFGLEAKVL